MKYFLNVHIMWLHICTSEHRSCSALLAARDNDFPRHRIITSVFRRIFWPVAGSSIMQCPCFFQNNFLHAIQQFYTIA